MSRLILRRYTAGHRDGSDPDAARNFLRGVPWLPMLAVILCLPLAMIGIIAFGALMAAVVTGWTWIL